MGRFRFSVAKALLIIAPKSFSQKISNYLNAGCNGSIEVVS
jgi:hypothetical protein